MAWTDPRTWTTSEIVKVSHFNTHVRDALRETASLLGVAMYSPVGATNQTTAAGGAVADIDSTNLAVTFTVPYSGVVLVRLTGIAKSSNAGSPYGWGVREGTTNIAYGLASKSTSGERAVLDLRVTGLTANTSKTWKFAHSTGDAAVTGTFSYGGSFGAASIEVWSS